MPQQFRILDDSNLFFRQSYQLREALHHDIDDRLAQGLELPLLQALLKPSSWLSFKIS